MVDQGEVLPDNCDTEENHIGSSDSELDGVCPTNSHSVEEHLENSESLDKNGNACTLNNDNEDNHEILSEQVESFATTDKESDTVNVTDDISCHESVEQNDEIVDKESEEINAETSNTNEAEIQEGTIIAEENENAKVKETDDNPCQDIIRADDEIKDRESDNSDASNDGKDTEDTTYSTIIDKKENDIDNSQQDKVPNNDIDISCSSQDPTIDKSTVTKSPLEGSLNNSMDESEQADTTHKDEISTPIPQRSKKTVSFDDEAINATASKVDKIDDSISNSNISTNHTVKDSSSKSTPLVSNSYIKSDINTNRTLTGKISPVYDYY